MADLEQRLPGFMPMPPPFRREGHNPDEPIMIGSSDDEDDHVHRPAGPGRGTIEEQRARLHHNRTGTPIPRALENGLRILSPPPLPPPPHHHHHHPWHRRPDWPHPHLHNQNQQSIQQRLAQIGMVRSPDALRRLLGHDHVGRILNMIFPGFGDQPVQNQQQNARDQEYDVRMTHSRAKPRIGFSYDFAPDEEDENGAGEGTGTRSTSAVRTRTTIVIPDSPPVEPVDRKGKGRAKTPPDVDEILDLESEEFTESVSGPSTSVSSPRSAKSRKRRAVETIEILSDDEGEADQSAAAHTVLVCASCRRPLRIGGERLWALRCGHMIDSRCYRKLGERVIVQEVEPAPVAIPVLEPEPAPAPSTSRPAKRRKVSGGRARAKKTKPVVVAPVVPAVVEPYQAEILEWRCPVLKCGRAHWSERIVTAGKSAWQPMKETGAIGVFV